jgi:YspA, cpYpsA-related SLOG family
LSHYCICTGGRDYNDRETVEEILGFMHKFYGDELRILHGAARGADTLVAETCEMLGIRVKAYPADWSKGNGAGLIRNAEMVAKVVSWRELGHAASMVAFLGGNGTRDCANRGERALIPVSYIPENWMLERVVDVGAL